MEVALVTAPSGGYLDAVRRVLSSADEALVCVAFAQARGVHLVADELTDLSKRGNARVVVTTTLGASSAAALSAIQHCRSELRVLNPGGATYHPKVFLGRRGDEVQAVVGSANLTSGLVANVEAGTVLRGARQDPPLDKLWSWAESIWNDRRIEPWLPPSAATPAEAIEPELLALLRAAVRANPTVYTLGGKPQPNFVRDVTAAGAWVETQRSRERQVIGGTAPAQYVPPSMFNLAWDALRARGRLSNRELLDELRVHRSSFVCAFLARLPGVIREPGREIVLRYQP